ncbi:MAG: linear amide C-N hydrolase, partial [Lysobacter sp.]|nr:linear amide C-N hydrolase [Lysobacter sp.]
SSNALEFCDIAAWAMSQFATVPDVVAALAGVNVIGPAVGSQSYLPLHFIATDATGASVVIEFVGGAMNVYPPDYADGATGDGVLTNAPTYDWQRTNLSSYVHLSVEGAGTSTSNDSGPPVGSGLLGLPGDIMSASRFVKAATFRQGFGLLPGDGEGWLPTPATAGATDSTQTIVNVALQMVQMIQATPYGTALLKPTTASPSSSHPHLKARAPSVGDWTMWQVARDHTNFVYYYSTAFNSIVQKVDLTTVDFSGGSVAASALKSIQVMPAASAWYSDASAGFA